MIATSTLFISRDLSSIRESERLSDIRRVRQSMYSCWSARTREYEKWRGLDNDKGWYQPGNEWRTDKNDSSKGQASQYSEIFSSLPMPEWNSSLNWKTNRELPRFIHFLVQSSYQRKWHCSRLSFYTKCTCNNNNFRQISLTFTVARCGEGWRKSLHKYTISLLWLTPDKTK